MAEPCTDEGGHTTYFSGSRMGTDRGNVNVTYTVSRSNTENFVRNINISQ